MFRNASQHPNKVLLVFPSNFITYILLLLLSFLVPNFLGSVFWIFWENGNQTDFPAAKQKILHLFHTGQSESLKETILLLYYKFISLVERKFVLLIMTQVTNWSNFNFIVRFLILICQLPELVSILLSWVLLNAATEARKRMVGSEL